MKIQKTILICESNRVREENHITMSEDAGKAQQNLISTHDKYSQQFRTITFSI